MFPAAWRSLTESARHLCRSSDPWWTEVSLHSSLQRNFTSRCPFTVCVCIKVSSWFVQQTQTTLYVLLSEVIYNSLVMFHRVWTSGAWLYFGTGTTFAHIRGVSASALPLWQSHGRLLRSRDTFEQIIGERGVPWLPCCYWAAHRFHSSIQLSGQLGSAPVLPSFTGHSPASSASDPGHLFNQSREESVKKGFRRGSEAGSGWSRLEETLSWVSLTAPLGVPGVLSLSFWFWMSCMFCLFEWHRAEELHPGGICVMTAGVSTSCRETPVNRHFTQDAAADVAHYASSLSPFSGPVNT